MAYTQQKHHKKSKASILKDVVGAAKAFFHRSRTPRRTVLLLLPVLGTIALLMFGVWRVWDDVNDRLARERSLIAERNRVPFEANVCPRVPARGDVQILQNTNHVKGVARYKDSYFAATEGGLVRFSPSGNLLRHYTVLDGLPESDLTAVIVYDAKLYVGTRTRGLIAFDGEWFTRYSWADRQAQAVSALLVDEGKLLIGTFAGGLLQFDGQVFTELKAGPEQAKLTGITSLTKAGGRLYVGTFSNGLWAEVAGRWEHFTTAHGLLSDRVVGVAEDNSRVLVASDFGLTVAPAESLSLDAAGSEKFRSLATLPALSSIALSQGKILVSRESGELFTVSEESRSTNQPPLQSCNWAKPTPFSDARLIVADDQLWLLGEGGLWRADEVGPRRGELSLAPFGQIGPETMPASNLISTLALDREGRLWSGNFRRGIDLFAQDGKRITHLESDSLREINYLLDDVHSTEMLAATSAGVFRFDPLLRASPITKADGLLSNAVAHLALASSEPTANDRLQKNARRSAQKSLLLFATNRGLSVGEPGRMRALTRVQGLPSDNLYTILKRGDTIFIGTLGGLVQIDRGRVARIFTDANSRLAQNWVTALCVIGDRLMIGTYGGGVFELTPSGEIQSFASETGKFVVNPNAMWSDANGERLFVGTLDGVRVFDAEQQRWSHIKGILPSPVVLSITGDAKFTYFGTTSGIARVKTSYWSEAAKER